MYNQQKRNMFLKISSREFRFHELKKLPGGIENVHVSAPAICKPNLGLLFQTQYCTLPFIRLLNHVVATKDYVLITASERSMDIWQSLLTSS